MIHVLSSFATVVHIVTCVLLILVVLIQSGKGAEISASFAGSSQTVFGSSGGQNFFTIFTYCAAAVFMFTSIALTKLGNQDHSTLFAHLPATQNAPAAPAAPAAPGAATTGQPAAPNAAATGTAAPANPAAPAPQSK